MSRQELANASGVSIRTITSFEDVSDRIPTPANLAAITLALQRLGVVFNDGGVGWSPPFSESQIRVIRALTVRNGPHMASAMDVVTETGCSRLDLEVLSKLQIITGIDGYPTLTAIGLHIPALLRNHENREIARKTIFAPINYTVHLDDNSVFHAQTSTVFRIEKDGTLSLLFSPPLFKDQLDDIAAGARDALRLDRERDPRLVGKFVWGG